MPGPAPKPAHLRQRQNKKAGFAMLEMPTERRNAPAIPNPDKRTWHPLTVSAWETAWNSPMAGQWLATDVDALGRLALLWDEFYKGPEVKVMAEIRLQESRFGLSPLDRSRLQWEIAKADEAERKRPTVESRKPRSDPRAMLRQVS